MKDRFGKSLKIADRVLTAVLNYRRAHLKEAIITNIVNYGQGVEKATLKGLQNPRTSDELIKI